MTPFSECPQPTDASSDTADWLAVARRIEALEDLPFDVAIVNDAASRARTQPGPATTATSAIHFYTPSFKAFQSSEIQACGKNAWPAVSITGGDCKLQCDHCKAKILAPMIPARTPEALARVVEEIIAGGARGMLLTGGSNHRNEVEYDPYYPVIRRIKDAHPSFRIAAHTALMDRTQAARMAEAGVDVAMMDVIGAQETITQVYHLKRPVEDFERTLANLVATPMKVVPHIVLGLHYGRFLGEERALEMIARHKPQAVVLVVVMPFYAPRKRPFAVPDPHTVGRFFLKARARLPDIPLLLGCARPPGPVKALIDAYAVMAGLDGIAHPADGIVELAVRLGRRVRVTAACCSIAVGEEVLALAEESSGLVLDVEAVLREEARRRRGRERLGGLPVVAR
jgi:uncharacterized radical SAM superfamily protein